MLYIINSLSAQRDCLNVLLTEVFSDSEVAIRISGARMKLTTKIIAPLMITEIIKDQMVPPFYSITWIQVITM